MIVVRHSYISPRGKIKKAGSMRAARKMAIGTALGHVKYIQHRPGEDREKGGRELFNDQGDKVDGKALRQAIKEHDGTGVVIHKLMLSPEINPADPKEFTREVMKQLGDEKGLDLRWWGTAHRNTDHHHIHVVVLAKDKNGREVRFSKRDYELMKEYGDRYLERHHPRELADAKREREDKERQRLQERQQQLEKQRQERIREGGELPWLHKKIIREQLEPYQQWHKKQLEKELAEAANKRAEAAVEAPMHQDTIEAAGRDWTQADKLDDLQRLNEYLWEHPRDRIPRDEYKKLVSWIKEKEAAQRQADKTQAPAEAKDGEQNKGTLEHNGNQYTKDDSYEKLTGLARELREKRERLSIEQYQQLRGWIENKERERFSDILEKELASTHKKFERSKTEADLKAAEGGRVVDPLQAEMFKNPIMGLFMTEASIANELVRSIVLDDRNRDYLKENRDDMIEATRDLDDKEKEKENRTPSEKARDMETREKLEKGIDEIARKRNEEKKKRKNDKERGDDDWDRFDPWGRY